MNGILQGSSGSIVSGASSSGGTTGRSSQTTSIISGVEDITFFDGSTMRRSELECLSSVVSQFQVEDPMHILIRSVKSDYIIPRDVAIRFTTFGIMGEHGQVDSRIVKILQNMELSCFHTIGRGASAANAAQIAESAERQMKELLEKNDHDGAAESKRLRDQARKDADVGEIVTYDQLFNAGYASISGMNF